MVTIANKRWISIRNIIIYLESKFRRNRRIFVFWRPPNTKILRFGQNWFPSRLWCCKLISTVWEPCYDPSDHIISCYYYYYYYSSSTSSRCDFVRPNSRRLMIRSILNFTKYKNPPIWKKFDFQVDYDVANWYQSLVCYVGHFVNDLRYQWKWISRSIMKWGIGWCPEFWYGGRW